MARVLIYLITIVTLFANRAVHITIAALFF